MSGKSLIIVESPSKIKSISKFVGDEFEVISCVGHFKDLPKNELAVDVENNFSIKLEVYSDKKDFIKSLKQKAKKAPKIYLATDPDREGEAIAHHLAQEVAGSQIERVQFTEITRSGVKEGMKHPRDLDHDLVEAQKARRIIDRLVGYKISALLWSTIQKTLANLKSSLSAGRVQSAAVKILVDRERERMRFKEATYFDLKAEMLTDKGEPFTAVLYSLSGMKLAIGKDFDPSTGELKKNNVMMLSESQAKVLIDELNPGPWVVSNKEEKPQTSNPPPPFITSTLQQEAGRKLRFSAQRTMSTSQKLYESGFITYMRTDSVQLSTEAVQAARSYIQSNFGEEYLPEKPIYYKSKVKNAQEAHEAIRPAGSSIKSVEEVKNSLGDDAANLYRLIRMRTLACQMKSAKILRTIVLLQNQKAVFRSTGKVIKFPGYRLAYIESQPERRSNDEDVLPPIDKGDELSCEKLTVDSHTTKPPPRFSESSLIKEMANRGIGRPSTYHSIISGIQRRDYVNQKKRKLMPSFVAVAVTQLLENHFEPLVNIDFSANLEDRLDQISRGELNLLPFMNDFYFGDSKIKGLEKMLEEDIDIRKACTMPIPSSNGEEFIARLGRFGPYIDAGEDNRRSIPLDFSLGDLSDKNVKELLSTPKESSIVELGNDPESGEMLLLKNGRYGPYIETSESTKRKSIPKGMEIENVNLEFAIKLIGLPKTIGTHPETGEPVTADYGRYGPYIRSGRSTAPLKPPPTPLTVTLDEAVTALAKRNKKSSELSTLGKHPETGEELILKDGRYGPFITDGKVNASLPKTESPDSLTLDIAVDLINKKRAAPKQKRKRRKK